MFLAFKLSDIITVPFGYLLSILYHSTKNYGVAMILFALVVQLVLLPIKAKSKKSMMKMSRLTPRMQDIQKRYASDPQKQNEMIQQLYKEEGVSMGGGCLWSFIPLLILFPLFTVIREPITYILMESAEVTQQIIATIKAAAPEIFTGNSIYDQVIAAQAIPQFAQELSAVIPGISQATLEGINFDFVGVNLGLIPSWKFWAWEVYDWAHIGAFLLPLLSAGSQNQSMQAMLFMMPLMSLWIGFTVSAGLSLYWLIGGVFGTITDAIMTKKYRTIYDAEDAERLKRAMEQDRIEAEKERVRAERRAANPDGITENTSKKKLQKQQRELEASQKAAAAKDYAARKGICQEGDEPDCMSGIADRPYCKGRSYDPNRYRSNPTEE